MSRLVRAVLGGVFATLVWSSAPALAAPGGLGSASASSVPGVVLVHGHGFGGGFGHFGGHWGGAPHFSSHFGHGPLAFGGNWGHHGHHFHHGYPFIFYGGGYPYYDDYSYDDYYADTDACYYSRRLHARVCPDYDY